MFVRTATLAVAALCLAPTAASAIAPVTSGIRGAQIAVTGPIGQSFVADAVPLSSFGFQFAVSNSASAVTPLTFELRAGVGLSGMLIASTSATPSIPTGRTPTWYDFSLSGISLTVGQSYTALVSTTSTRLALIFGPNLATNGTPATGDAYADGSLISTSPVDTVAGGTGYCATSGVCDANFRVNAVAAAVPEPAAWASMTLGFLVLGTALRRRSSGGNHVPATR